MTRRSLTRLFSSVALVITASAALIIFVAIPVGWLDRQHLLPGGSAFAIVIALFPIIAAWGRAGLYFVLVVTACELTLVVLKPGVRRARIEAIVAVGVCTLAYLYIYLSVRFNFH
jgi:hypothetical protein